MKGHDSQQHQHDQFIAVDIVINIQRRLGLALWSNESLGNFESGGKIERK